ncbi:MAG: hypothetical protein N2050_00070 [Flavobacteriales bacterium]|nr:hypothetical protein [Flavobacteriales bacterium]
MRWLTRRPRRRIEAPRYCVAPRRPALSTPPDFATTDCEQPVLRYAARSAATQEPAGVLRHRPFDTACCASLLRDRVCGG